MFHAALRKKQLKNTKLQLTLHEASTEEQREEKRERRNAWQVVHAARNKKWKEFVWEFSLQSLN